MSRDGSRLRLGAVVLFAVLMVSATVVPVFGHGGVTSGAVASETQWAAPASVLGAEAGSVENRRIARTLIQESNLGSEAKCASLDALNVTIEGHVGPNRTKADPFAEDRQIVRATKDDAPKATVAILDAEAALARTAIDDAVRARDELEARNHSSDADVDIKGHYKYDTDTYIEINTTKYDDKNITRLSDNTDSKFEDIITDVESVPKSRRVVVIRVNKNPSNQDIRYMINNLITERPFDQIDKDLNYGKVRVVKSDGTSVTVKINDKEEEPMIGSPSTMSTNHEAAEFAVL